MQQKFLFRFIVATCCALAFTRAMAGEISLIPEDWHLMSYRGIPSHTISSQNSALVVSVKRSASPLVTLLHEPAKIKQLEIKAKITGELKLPKGSQGRKGADDFRLRVGLIFAGDTVLNPFRLTIAPTWIKQLYALLPEDTGVSYVQFWNTYLDPELANQSRIHPAFDRWQEHFALEVDGNGQIYQRIKIAETAKLLGIWISSDGDDTGSSFEVNIEHLRVD